MRDWRRGTGGVGDGRGGGRGHRIRDLHVEYFARLDACWHFHLKLSAIRRLDLWEQFGALESDRAWPCE
jgi:hypothetical protein